MSILPKSHNFQPSLTEFRNIWFYKQNYSQIWWQLLQFRNFQTVLLKFVRTIYIGVVFYSSLNFAVSTPHQAGIMKVRSASVDKNYERKPFLKLRENSTEKAKNTKEKSWANCWMLYAIF